MPVPRDKLVAAQASLTRAVHTGEISISAKASNAACMPADVSVCLELCEIDDDAFDPKASASTGRETNRAAVPIAALRGLRLHRLDVCERGQG